MKIEFDGVKINVPNSWNDITLEEYEKLYLLKPETKLEYIQYVADVCRIDAKLLINSPTQLFEIVSNAIQFIFDNDFEPVNKVVVDETEYFISFSDKLTLGEWVDIDSIIKSDSDTKLSEMLAVLCRPIEEKYNPDFLDERKKIFQSLSCDKVLPLISFFLLKKRKSDVISNHCLAVVAQANQFLKDTKSFAQNGDGIKQLPTWQMIRYYYLMRSLKKQLSKFSDFYCTNRTKLKRRRSNINLRNK